MPTSTLPSRLQDFTSLNAADFVFYTNEIGWQLDDVFTTLLTTVGYFLHRQWGRHIHRRSEREVGIALTVLIFELLPFSCSAEELPELPTEIWECIIDWIGAGPKTETGTLHACTLVCRLWLDRARLHLYRDIYIWDDRILKFQQTLRTNLCLSLSSTKKIVIQCVSNPISALFTISRLEKVDHFVVRDLDLSLEHSVIMRGILPRSVTKLELHNLKYCTVSNLLRFLNSFHSLTALIVHLDFSHMRDNVQVLPSPRPRIGRSLTDLTIRVIPGLVKLIEWYIREGHFLATLKKLHLRWALVMVEADHLPCFDSAISLLGHCANTLEELSIESNFDTHPFVKDVSEAVVISSFPKLQRVSWSSNHYQHHAPIFHAAATQLSSVLSPCKIAEINFLVDLPDYEPAKDYCKLIDEALTSDNFPSLRHILLFHRIPFDYFPILQSRNLLKTIAYVCAPSDY